MSANDGKSCSGVCETINCNQTLEVLIMRRSTRGFTLVEILIVVIILGILAAIVIPQFTNASQDARESSLLSQLQTLRSQIELYKLQHMDKLPNLVGGGPGNVVNWNPLTTKTDASGNPSAASDAFGPYMQSAPSNPINGLTAVVDGDTGMVAAGSDCGFIYDYA